jgi:hypothetical protein
VHELSRLAYASILIGGSFFLSVDEAVGIAEHNFVLGVD